MLLIIIISLARIRTRNTMVNQSSSRSAFNWAGTCNSVLMPKVKIGETINILIIFIFSDQYFVRKYSGDQNSVPLNDEHTWILLHRVHFYASLLSVCQLFCFCFSVYSEDLICFVGIPCLFSLCLFFYFIVYISLEWHNIM